MSKPIIFWFVAIHEANQRINKKGKKMASSLINLVTCSGLLAHILLIYVFRLIPVAYRPWASPRSTNLEKIFWCPEIWNFSSPSFRKPLCNGGMKGDRNWPDSNAGQSRKVDKWKLFKIAWTIFHNAIKWYRYSGHDWYDFPPRKYVDRDRSDLS